MRRVRVIITVCGMGAVLAAVERADGGFSGIVLFGDSLTDVGNVYDQTFGISPQSPPYFNGRWSNGPLWAERVAQDLGLPALAPSRQGGRDYAFGGTKTGAGSSFYFPFFFPNIGTQINNFLGSSTPNPGDLHVIWGGGNDFIDGQSNPQVPVNNIVNHVTALRNAGATQFLVPNLPPLGQVPRFKGTANEAVMDQRTGQFNDLLAPALDNLESSLGVQIFQLDVEGLFNQMLQNPAQFGFTNTTGTALVGGTPVPNQDEYVFWDDIHPTRVAHGILGSIAGDVVVTHEWASTQTGGSWSNPLNWDPQGVPDSDWIAHVVNDNIAQPQAVAVDVASTSVQHVLVRGDTAPMTLIVQSIATLNAASIAIAQQGRLDLHGGAIAAASVHVASGGSLSGTGDVNANVINNGIVSPGEPGTELRIDGDFTQSSSASLIIDLGGTATDDYDRLLVAGSASLAGTLAVRLIDFVALPGQSFEVLTFDARQGDVSIVNQTGFAGLHFDKTYSATALTLTADALGGDANLDGLVNLSDFNALAANFGQDQRTWLQADFNGDGLVNLADFNILASNFGISAGPAGPDPQDWAALSAVVPEPSPAHLIGLFSAGVLRRARRARARVVAPRA